MFEKLIDLAILKWRSTFFIIFLLFVFGIAGYVKIPKESNPEITIPYISISVTYKGVSPEDGERMLIKPIENEVKSIAGVKKIECKAYLGYVNCGVEFQAGVVTVERALTDVRDAVNRAKSEFPKEADEPFVKEYQSSEEPVLTINISGELSDDVIFKIADDLKEKLTGLREVLDVEVSGKRDHSVEILIKPEVVNQYKLNIADFQNIANQNNLITGGKLRNGDGEFTFQVPGLIMGLKDLSLMPIKTTQNGEVLTLGQLAEIKKTYKDATSYSRLNGKRTVSLSILKRSGENVMETVAKVHKIVEEYIVFLPKNVIIDYSNDTSQNVKDDLTNLNNNLILAVIIVFFIVLNLVGLRESLIIMATIPLTFLMGIMFLYFGGHTMNIVVLFALILGTGMIVDASIVIIEYSELLIKDGVPHTEAFKRAAKRMFIPVFSSVVTVIIVASPLLFWPGVVGQFMKYLPLTLIALLSSSFIAAIFFLPCIGSKFGKSHIVKENEINFSSLIKMPIQEVLAMQTKLGFYARIVWKLLENPKKTLFGLFLFLVFVGLLYAKFNKGMEFMPDVETDFARVRIESTGNLSLEEKDKLVREVEEIVSKIPDVKKYQTRTPTSGSRGIGRIDLEFTDWDKRRKPAIILQEIREKTSHLPGILIKTGITKFGPSAEKAISLNILGRDSTEIESTMNKLKTQMLKDGSFIDIEDNSTANKIQYSFKVDRAKAGKYGVDISTIGAFISLATDGLIISNYRPSYSDDKVDIVLRFPKEYRKFEDIKNLKIPSNAGVFVPLSSIGNLEMEREVTIISRLNQKRVINLNANLRPDVVSSLKIQEFFEWIKENRQEFEAEIEFAGDKEDMDEAQTFLVGAFLSAIIIMVLLFLMQFNSFGKTVIVISSIFLSMFGVLIALLLTGQAFSIVMSGIAIIALAGIVVDSNILYIETFKDLQERNLEMKEALLKSSLLRLKPILLASMTTVAGMVPMIFGVSINFIERDLTMGAPSGQFWTQLSAGIAGGLTFVTLLTLFITPTIIFLEENFKKK